MSEFAAKSRARSRASPPSVRPDLAQAAPAKSHAPGLLQSAGSAFGLGVQRAVAVGEPNDRFEREADDVADRIVNGRSVEPSGISQVTPEALAQKAETAPQPEAGGCTGAGACAESKQDVKPLQKASTAPEKQPESAPLAQKKSSGPTREEQQRATGVQRMSAATPEQKKPDLTPFQKAAKDETVKPVQTDSAGGAPAASTDAAASQAISSKGPGTPLAPATRNVLESGLGADLGHVRVHDDSAARASAQALNARAFTHGDDIWLGPGASQDDTRLMAHEATHVVQQAGGLRRMVQRAGGKAKTETAKTSDAKTGAAASSGKTFKTDKGEIFPDSGRMELPLLEVPKFKADFLKPDETSNVTIRNKEAGERDTSQREIWLKELGQEVEANAEKLLKKQPGGQPKIRGDGAGKQDSNSKVFFYRIGNSKNLLIGTAEELKSAFVIPRWDKNGRPRAMDIDHKKEYQLGGKDEISNMQALDAKANRSAGSRISGQVNKAIREALNPFKGKPPFGKLDREEISRIRATYKIKFTKIQGSDKLESSNELADNKARWDADEVKKVEEPFKALTPLKQEEIEKIAGSMSNLVLFPLEGGGSPLHFPWSAKYSGPQKGKLGASDSQGRQVFRGLHDGEIKFVQKDDEAGSGSIRGKFRPGRRGKSKADFSIEEKDIDLPLLGIPDLPYTARMQKGGLLASMRHAQLYGLSPVEFYEAHFDEKKGIVAHGRLLPSLSIFRKVPIEILVEGDDVYLEATFTKDSFALPRPIKVTDGSLTLAVGPTGATALAHLGISIERLGAGQINATPDGDGVELHGVFDIDKKIAPDARIKVDYVHDSLTVGGRIAIPPGHIRGIKSASIEIEYSKDRLSGRGSVKPDIPAVESADLTVDYDPKNGLRFSGDLAIKNDTPGIAGGSVHIEAQKPEGEEQFKVKAAGKAKPKIPGVDTELAVSYDDGLFDASILASYKRGRLKGSIQAGVTNRPVTDGQPSGPAPEKSGKPADLTVYGGGALTITLGPLEGIVGVHILPDGEVEVGGEIALTTRDLPPQLGPPNKKLLDFPSLHIPIWGVSFLGHDIGVFATVGGGIEGYATIGPGVLTGRLGVLYNPAHEENTRVWGKANWHLPAQAGIRLFVYGGIGLSLLVVKGEGRVELGAGLGVEGALDAGVCVEWTPTKGLSFDALACFSVQPKLIVDLKLKALVEADVFLGTITLWEPDPIELAKFEFGSSLALGVNFPVHYEEGQPFDFSLDKVKFTYPDIDPLGLAKDIITSRL